MDTVIAWISKTKITDIIGLGFAGVAAYGMVTGRIPAASITTALAVSGPYLGIKINQTVVAASAATKPETPTS